MDFLTIIGAIFIIGMSLIIYLRERKYKLIYKGRNQNFYMIPLIIIIFIVATFFTEKTFKAMDIIVVIAIIPLAFVGNKAGITEDGILLSSYLTKWDKIEAYSVNEKNNRYVLFYESNGMTRKLTFSKEIGEQVNNYLAKNRKIRHRKNSVL